MQELNMPLLIENAAEDLNLSSYGLVNFLSRINIKLEDIQRLAVKRRQNPDKLIEQLNKLLAYEQSCSSNFKWASLDHLAEKLLQSIFLSETDVNPQTNGCNVFLRPAERSILLKSQTGLLKAYSIRGFVKGVELALEKSVHYFVYAMLIYRFVAWVQTGNLQLEELEKLWTNNSQKGIDTLVNILSNIEPNWLTLILNAPLLVGGGLGLVACFGHKPIRHSGIKEITEQIDTQLQSRGNAQSVPSGELMMRSMDEDVLDDDSPPSLSAHSSAFANFFRNTFLEIIPILSLSALSQKIQKLERIVRWDGRIGAEKRIQLFDLIHKVATQGKQFTQLHAMASLARIAHGIGLKDLVRLKKAGYAQEDIVAILYTKAMALQDLTTLTESRQLKRVYAHYLLWWLGQSDSWTKQRLPFSAFKIAKLAAEIYFLNKLVNSIITAINCPDKPGFQFAEGYADWASNYGLDCFNKALYYFRKIDPNENISAFLSALDNYHLADLTELDLSDKNLNETEFYHFIQKIAPKATQLKVLKANRNSIRAIEPNTFQGLSQLTHLELVANPGINLITHAFRGLNQLKILYLDNSVNDIAIGAFQDLGQLRELYPTFLAPGSDFFELTHTSCKHFLQSDRLFSSAMY